MRKIEIDIPEGLFEKVKAICEEKKTSINESAAEAINDLLVLREELEKPKRTTSRTVNLLMMDILSCKGELRQ
jgi:metal-responsive CopG/Arc/MetJ family transcriptional regulator